MADKLLPPGVLEILAGEPELAIPAAVAYRGYQIGSGINSIYEHYNEGPTYGSGAGPDVKLPAPMMGNSADAYNRYTSRSDAKRASQEEKQPLIPRPGPGEQESVSQPPPEDNPMDDIEPLLPNTDGI